MPVLGSHLDFAKLEARNVRIHQLSAAPGSPVTGQLYYDTVANVLYYYNGTAWVSAAGGSPPDATAAVKGVVQLAGDLTGTAAAPAVATGAITSAKIADGTITDVDVAAANKDGVVGLASLRTLGAGAQQAMPGNRTLDAITVPAAPVSLNSQRITNQADPTSPQDSATKNYVDNLVQGLDAKASVRVMTTTLTGGVVGGAQTIDGIAIATNDRVLIANGNSPGNGIYIANTGATWNRATDMDSWAEVPSSYVWVESGTVNADTGWVCTADAGGTLGTTNITWTKFSSANLGANAAQYYSTSTMGASTTISITAATHGLRGQRGLHVQVYDNTSGLQELPDIAIDGSGNVTITYAVAITANSKTVVIIG
jgi:Repeat of unknown function (DUF5907)